MAQCHAEDSAAKRFPEAAQRHEQRRLPKSFLHHPHSQRNDEGSVKNTSEIERRVFDVSKMKGKQAVLLFLPILFVRIIFPTRIISLRWARVSYLILF